MEVCNSVFGKNVRYLDCIQSNYVTSNMMMHLHYSLLLCSNDNARCRRHICNYRHLLRKVTIDPHFCRVDVRASAFSVPPQQFVTSDGGIAEMGGDIQYGIVDVVTMVSEVVDHQLILRSLSKTLLVKTLVRKSVRQIQKERLSIACEIQDEINLQVRKWGIHIQRVDLSEPYIGKV